MTAAPEIHCDGWNDGADIPIEYTAPKDDNVQPAKDPQPKNKQPKFTFTNVPEGTRSIAFVVHDVLEGEPVDGVRPGWTHYTAILSPDGEIQVEGETSEPEPGWVGPYPLDSGEYHCTAYFLSDEFPAGQIDRAKILQVFDVFGLGSANMVGKYTNPLSSSK